MTEQEIQKLLQRVEALEVKAERADDYRQICNCMAGHSFCYNAHEQAYEIKRFWTKEREDSFYNGNTGPEGVAYYYINNTKALRAKQREIVNRVYGLQLTEEDKVGYRVINMLGSPFIEIAGDGMTAQGVWMTFNVLCHVNEEGKPQPSVSVGKLCAEFCKENGVWRLWRFRECPGGFGLDVKLTNDGTDPDAEKNARLKMSFGAPHFTEEEQKILRKRELDCDMENLQYKPWVSAVNDPPLPEPYESWEEVISFFHFKD